MAYSTEVLADSPLGYWRLGETSGTNAVNAGSVGSTDGTYTGGYTLDTASLLTGDADPSVLFNGSTGYVAIPASTGFNVTAITLEAWFKTSSATAQAIINRNYSSNGANYYSLGLTSAGKLQFGLYGTPTSILSYLTTTTDSFNDGVLHHVCATFDGTYINVYVDGLAVSATYYYAGTGTDQPSFFWINGIKQYVLDPTALTWSGASGPATSNHAINVGRRPGGGGTDYFNGTLDEVAIYDHGLTRARATAHYYEGSGTVEPPADPVAGEWTPLVERASEEDTLWLFDPDTEAADYPASGEGVLVDAKGMLTSLATCNPWRVGSGYTITTGKFLSGVTGNATASSYLYQPGVWLPKDQFTVEFWVKSTRNWSSDVDTHLVSFGVPAQDSVGIHMSVDPTVGYLRLTARNKQVTPAMNITINDVAHPPVADELLGYALTYDGTTLTLYRFDAPSTISVVGTAAFTTPPLGFGNYDAGEGMQLHYNPGSTHNQYFTISDVRISRKCRVPGAEGAQTISATNTVTVTDTPTGATVNTRLRGAVGYPSTTSTLAQGYAADNTTVARLAKEMTATPIKAGAPDATHPTLGHSGSYSYDWRAVDRSYQFLTDLGHRIYGSNFGCPYILGGTSPPWDETKLSDTTRLVNGADENNQVPSDFAAFGTIQADLAYYTMVTQGYDVYGWGFWNEPDLAGHWPGTRLQFNQLFEATVNAVKAVVPSAYMGGPEISDLGTAISWITGTNGLVKYCADNTVPLDFISFHLYHSDLGRFAQYKEALAAEATLRGLGYTPDFLCTEWGWSSQANSIHPFVDVKKWFANDWAASFYTSALMAGQTTGLDSMMYFALGAIEIPPGTNGPNGALYAAAHPWTGLNVMESFRQLEGAV